jgi:hypothetical protein
MLMRTAAVLALLMLAACGGSHASSSTSPAPATQTVRVGGSTGSTSLSMTVNDESSSHMLAYAPAAVWQLVPWALDSLGVPVRSLEPTQKRAGNTGFAVRRRLKTVPLSRYVDCGSTHLGPNADDYDVNLSVFSEVRPADGGASTVVTTVEAAARPANYAQEYSRCTSKGVLETRLIELLKARLAR